MPGRWSGVCEIMLGAKSVWGNPAAPTPSASPPRLIALTLILHGSEFVRERSSKAVDRILNCKNRGIAGAEQRLLLTPF
jgi:hypothetical protein